MRNYSLNSRQTPLILVKVFLWLRPLDLYHYLISCAPLQHVGWRFRSPRLLTGAQMLKMQLRVAGQDPVVAALPLEAPPRPAWLAYGFRPFFLSASIAAVLLMGIWLLILSGFEVPHTPSDPIRWHAHEMLFGFGGAVVAGFLLTAVPNWTGLPTPKDDRLGVLLGLWLLGRFGSWEGGGGAALDLFFIPALALALGGPLWRAGQARNLVFLPVLGLLWVSDLLFWVGPSASLALSLAMYGLLLLISIIAGRVVPFFTERALSGHRVRRWNWLEGLSPFALFISVLVEDWPASSPPLKCSVLCIAAGLHSVRLIGWGTPRILAVPLLWVLYLAYAFLPLGLLLRGLAWSGWGSLSAATHALTIGCIGLMCLGMMSRVALGHTGRELKPARITVIAFALLSGAACSRSLLIFFWPAAYKHALLCAGGLWSLAFSLYLLAYWPVLTRPRVDGKPG